jgi:hypothetical protein
MSTLREEVEATMGVAQPAKVGKRTPTWEFNQAPSAWRKTMKYWAALALGWVGGTVFSAAAIVLWEMSK